MDRFNRLYVKIFCDFHEKWKQYEKKHDVMQFNIFMIKYFENI